MPVVRSTAMIPHEHINISVWGQALSRSKRQVGHAMGGFSQTFDR